MDSFEKFKEGLPEKSKFYSFLSNGHIGDEDYEHVRVWKVFKVKILKEYCNLYFKRDVLLLAVPENFRGACLD